MNNNLSVSDAGSMIIGAGLTQLTSDLKISLGLVAFGVLLKVLVAIFQKRDIQLGSKNK